VRWRRVRGRPLRVNWRPEDTEAALKAAFRAERDPALRLRVQALWRIRAGDTIVDAAARVGVTERTARAWVARYRAGGLAALRTQSRPPPPPPSHLTADQWQAVRDHLRTGTPRTVAQLRAWIAAQWQRAYTIEGLRRALHRERMRRKVPRPRHVKTDRAVQTAWKKGGAHRR